MRLQRGSLEVVGDADGLAIELAPHTIDLDADEVRWLLTCALPAAMCAPSEPPAKDAEGALPGQVSIYDVAESLPPDCPPSPPSPS